MATKRANLSNDSSKISMGKGCDVSPSVSWGVNVELGDNVSISPYTVIFDNVKIGDHSFVGANCVIGEPAGSFYEDADHHESVETRIGHGSIIRSGAIIYEDVHVGIQFQSGNKACIREKVRIGDFCSVGTDSDIQADVHIDHYTRIHSSVHLAAGARAGKYVWILPGCTFTNDNLFPAFSHPSPPVIGDYSVIAANCFFYPGVRLGMHVVVAAGSHVKGEHQDFVFLEGNPAKKVCDVRQYFTVIDEDVIFPYPWPNRVDGDYPWKDIPSDKRKLEDYL